MRPHKGSSKSSTKIAKAASPGIVEAWKRVENAVHEFMNVGPAEKGASIMAKTDQELTGGRESFRCSECDSESQFDATWKYCPMCGAEILRWHRDEAMESKREMTLRPFITIERTEPKEVSVSVTLLPRSSV